MKVITLILPILLHTITASSQDSIATKYNYKLKYDLGAGMYYEAPTISKPYIYTYPKILLPQALEVRRPDQPIEQINWGLLNNSSATNNPLYHNAFYLDFGMQFKLDSLNITAHIIGEHRGESFGVYAPDEILFYPKINVLYNRNFNLLGRIFNICLSDGNRDNERLMEGLTIYNLDVQATYVSIQTGKLKYVYERIADLTAGVGLNIDDLILYAIEVDKTKINPKYFLDSKASYTVNLLPGTDSIRTSKNTYDISSAIYNKNARIYFQYSIRPYFGNFARESAGLIGITDQYKTSYFNFKGSLEARYYGSLYNQDFINANVYYRQQYPTNELNSVGTSLYPLQLFDRPFSQWAVFTEYQSLNVLAGTADIEAKYYFGKLFLINANMDFTEIMAEKLKPFVYDFYTIGIGAHINKVNEFTISLTNKAMNLDEHYMTFYLLKEPTYIFKFCRKISL